VVTGAVLVPIPILDAAGCGGSSVQSGQWPTGPSRPGQRGPRQRATARSRIRPDIRATAAGSPGPAPGCPAGLYASGESPLSSSAGSVSGQSASARHISARTVSARAIPAGRVPARTWPARTWPARPVSARAVSARAACARPPRPSRSRSCRARSRRAGDCPGKRSKRRAWPSVRPQLRPCRARPDSIWRSQLWHIRPSRRCSRRLRTRTAAEGRRRSRAGASTGLRRRLGTTTRATGAGRSGSGERRPGQFGPDQWRPGQWRAHQPGVRRPPAGDATRDEPGPVRLRSPTRVRPRCSAAPGAAFGRTDVPGCTTAWRPAECPGPVPAVSGTHQRTARTPGVPAAATAWLSTASADLPTTTAWLSTTAADLPTTTPGLSTTAAGLPATAAGLRDPGRSHAGDSRAE